MYDIILKFGSDRIKKARGPSVSNPLTDDRYLLQCSVTTCLYYYTNKFSSFADFIAGRQSLTEKFIIFFFSTGLLSLTALPRNSVVKPSTLPSPLTDRKELGHLYSSPAKPCNHLLYTYMHYMYILYMHTLVKCKYIYIYIKKNLVAMGKLRSSWQKITFLSRLLGDEWCDKECLSSRTIKTFIQHRKRDTREWVIISCFIVGRLNGKTERKR